MLKWFKRKKQNFQRGTTFRRTDFISFSTSGRWWKTDSWLKHCDTKVYKRKAFPSLHAPIRGSRKASWPAVVVSKCVQHNISVYCQQNSGGTEQSVTCGAGCWTWRHMSPSRSYPSSETPLNLLSIQKSTMLLFLTTAVLMCWSLVHLPYESVLL